MANSLRSIAVVALVMLSSSHAAEIVSTVQVGEGITQKYALLTDDNGKTITQVWALFMGGSGHAHVGVIDGMPVLLGRGLMTDGRHLFLRDNTAVAVIDAPSAMPKMPAEYRRQEAYLAGTEKVLDEIRAQFPAAKLYLVGHSNGTISAVTLGARMGTRVAGIALLGGVFRTLESFAAVKVSQPTLFMHHEKDACVGPGYNATLVEKYRPIIVEDIGASFPSRCGPYSAHHFHGQEAKVVDTTFRWIRGEALPARIR